jgi:hypothetical protein
MYMQVAARLEELMHADEYTAAAVECSTLLDTDAAAWEYWVGVFAAADRIEAIAHYIPTGSSSSSGSSGSSGAQQGRGALAGIHKTHGDVVSYAVYSVHVLYVISYLSTAHASLYEAISYWKSANACIVHTVYILVYTAVMCTFDDGRTLIQR